MKYEDRKYGTDYQLTLNELIEAYGEDSDEELFDKFHDTFPQIVSRLLELEALLVGQKELDFKK